jgi:predicted PurR-regulated permease PerM
MNERPEHKTASDPIDWGPGSRIHALVLLMATFAGIYICYLLSVPFLSALTWALVLAVLFASAHQLIEARLRRPNLSATLSVLIVALIVVVPTTFVAERLIGEATKGAFVIQTQLEGAFGGVQLRRIRRSHQSASGSNSRSISLRYSGTSYPG